MLDKAKNTKGFSLVEILLTASIFIMLASLGVGAYFQYYKASLNNIDINKTITHIKRARSLAQKNPNNSDYGVHIDTVNNQFIIFESMYTQGAPGNIILELQNLTIQDVSLNPNPPTRDILFERQTARTQNDGTITIGNQDTSFTISVNPLGVIE